MSLSKRLESLQSGASADVVQEFMKLSRDFGKAHAGKSYLTVWHSEPNWVRWVIKTYEGFTKREHRKFLKFIELMIEMEEKGATPTSIEMLREHQARQEPVMPLPAKAKAMPSQPVQETDLLVHLAEGSQEEWINTSSDISTDENIEALQARMSNVENALTEILNHVRQAPQ